MNEIPVIVVGAGPVGTTVAVTLAARGIPSLLLEREEAPIREWRGSTILPPTLELMDGLGLTRPMLEGGIVVRRYQYRDPELGRMVEFDLEAVAKDTPYPFRLQFEQYKLLELLHERARSDPLVTLRFGTEVVRAVDLGQVVEVQARSGNEILCLRSLFVVVAEGAQSSLRRSLGITFDGFTYPGRSLVGATSEPVDEDLAAPSPVMYLSTSAGRLSLIRTPDVWRLMVEDPLSETLPTIDDVKTMSTVIYARLSLALGRTRRPRLVEVRAYRTHQRVATRFRAGRVVLAGDAAHVNSPAGGMGLNSGIQDAFELTERLDRALRGGDWVGELETYARNRREAALRSVRAGSHRNRVVVAATGANERSAMFNWLASIASDPQRLRQWLLDALMIRPFTEFGPRPTRTD